MNRIAIMLSLAVIPVALCFAEPVTLVEDGQSDHVIVRAADAPQSVVDAANELQRVIRVATGVELPIVTDAASPAIVLGDCPQAAEAGVVGSEVPFEGYRILTAGQDVLIVGNDTREGEEPWFRHLSRGTYTGVHAFCEQFLDARWLMPGEVGEDIPAQDTVVIPEMDVTSAPAVPYRALMYVQGRYEPSVRIWKRRHGIHEYHRVSFPHAWDHFPPQDLVRQHPEWMAMYTDGTRQPVPGPGVRNPKYCLTNDGLIEAFADAVIAHFDEHPDRIHASLSPADGGGFCRCPECEKYRIEDDGGMWGDFAERGWSITPVILRFYNEVARRVADEYPDRTLGGLIYNAYTYPPDEIMQIEPNLVLHIAVLDHYGYKLYKPERAEELSRLMPAWSQFTDRLGWTDYSTWLRDPYGLPLPPGLQIIRMLFDQFEDHPIEVLNYTGHEAWGTGAMHNYIIAKLAWDPARDVDDLYAEFLERAYGPAAGHVDAIYDLSEEVLARYIRDNPGHRQPSYNSGYELVAEYYAPVFGRIEAQYAQALKAVETDAQRARVEMFGDVLRVLHDNLERAGLLEKPEDSIFHLSDADFAAFMADQADGLALNSIMRPDEDGNRKVLFSPEERKLAVPMLPPDADPPVIDGDPSDPAWGEGVLATGFRLQARRDLAPHQTEVRVLYDAEHLYVAARMFDDEIEAMRAEATSRDSVSLFEDDTFELFFSNKINWEINYWHIALNAIGGIYDNVALEADYDLDFRSAPAVGADAWAVEIAIPFESMNLDEPPTGETWKVNFARTRRTPPREGSTWAAVEDSYHEPRSFGEMTFVAP